MKDGVTDAHLITDIANLPGKLRETTFVCETRNSPFLDSTAISLLLYNAPYPIPLSNAAISQFKDCFARDLNVRYCRPHLLPETIVDV